MPGPHFCSFSSLRFSLKGNLKKDFPNSLQFQRKYLALGFSYSCPFETSWDEKVAQKNIQLRNLGRAKDGLDVLDSNKPRSWNYSSHKKESSCDLCVHKGPSHSHSNVCSFWELRKHCKSSHVGGQCWRGLPSFFHRATASSFASFFL